MFRKIFLIILASLSLQAAATISTNLNLLSTLSASNQYPGNIKLYGAIANDSLTDDVALSNAQLAKGEVRIPNGIFNVNTNITFSSTNDLVFERGGRLKPASGVTITINGGVKAGESQQIFDISAGGKILFVQTLGTAVSKIDKIWAGWWGPDNNNSGTTGDNTKLDAWLQSTASGVAIPKWISPGFYTVNTPLTLSNKWQVYGSGKPAISGSILANTSVFKVADSSDDVIIDGIAIAAYTSGTGTNVYGINIGLDCDRGVVRNCSFSGKLYGGAIYNSGNSLYWTFRNLFATGLDNTVANSGNGLLPSVFVKSTNVFSRTSFYDCVVVNSEMGLWLHGGSATNSGNISWIGGGFEGVGSIAAGTNTIVLNNISEFDIQNAHFENNTNVNLIYATGIKQFNSTDVLYSGDYGGSVKTTNLINLNNVGLANIRGGRFSNPLSYFITTTGESKPVYVWGSYFDAGGYTNISNSEVTARMNGNIIWDWATNSFSYGTYTPTITSTNNLAAISVGSFNYLKIGTVVTVSGAVNTTPGAGTTQVDFSLSLPIASDSSNISGTGTGSSSTLPASDYFPMRISTSAAPSPDVAICRYYAPNTNAEIINLVFTYLVP